ncbi:MAG: trehalose-phosphatase [Rhizobiaceae bacterium]
MNDGDTGDNSNNREIDVPNTAFFFDFDGTLAAIVDDPEQVSVSAAVLGALGNLYEISGGALAIVSGRPIAALDRFLAPLTLPLSGVHGLESRDAAGQVQRGNYDRAALRQVTDRITAYAKNLSGLVVEEKPGSVALHYRQAPDLGNSAQQLASKLAAAIPGVRLMRGKMVVELRLGGRSKGDAVSDFMAAAPFRGRKPLFAGDDVTDEDAFSLVENMSGTGIKIGREETTASFMAPDRDAFEQWLCELAAVPITGAKQPMLGGQIQRARRRSATGQYDLAAAAAATTGA